MRIATWNVNSLGARLEAVERWLDRAAPDVLLMQETKLADGDVPEMPFRMAGYEVLHHGEGRWNGVAIASRFGFEEPIVTNFGDGPVRDSRRAVSPELGEEDFDPSDEARMVSAVTGGLRVISVTTADVDCSGMKASCAGSTDGPLARDRGRWASPSCSAAPQCDAIRRGRSDAARRTAARMSERGERRWPAFASGGSQSLPRLAPAVGRSSQGLPPACSTATRHATDLYGTKAVARRVVWAEIDREARKGPPTPSDHAPVVVDLDEPGRPFDAGWDAALARIRARTRPR
jgi:exodeoxyribonuclease-3